METNSLLLEIRIFIEGKELTIQSKRDGIPALTMGEVAGIIQSIDDELALIRTERES